MVAVDAEAGPTEIAVLADGTADPVHVAADLISQAEHDVLAASVLVTDSVELADAVDHELARQVELTKHTERIRAALERQAVRDGPRSRPRARPAGRRWLRGRASRGDHGRRPSRGGAGAQRRLRVRRAARAGIARRLLRRIEPCPADRRSAAHASGLSVQTFLKGVHLVEYDSEALTAVAPHVLALADAEDLPAHGAAVSVRLPR